jgi:hypothetical protein
VLDRVLGDVKAAATPYGGGELDLLRVDKHMPFRALKTEPEVLAALLMFRRGFVWPYLWKGGHRPIPSWAEPNPSTMSQYIRPQGNRYVIPVPLFDEAAWMAAFEGLNYYRNLFPASRVGNDEWFFPLLALSKERPREALLRVLTSHVVYNDRDRCLNVLMWYCGYDRHPSQPPPPSSILSSPWLDTPSRYCLCSAYGRDSLSFFGASHAPFLPVYSELHIEHLLKSPTLRDGLIASLLGPWVVDEPARLEALLPFVTDSPLYPAACAAVKYTPLYEQLRKTQPKTFRDIPWISMQ